jgi:hypothetical protein
MSLTMTASTTLSDGSSRSSKGIHAAARATGDDALKVFADATRARVWRALQRRSEDGER